MSVKPVRTEADYDALLVRIELLMDAEPGTAEADELEVLATLADQYEERRFPVIAPTPSAAIRFRMEQQNLNARDLEPYLGSRSRVSEVLNGSRALSIDMIRALHQHLGIPAEVLIRPDPIPGSKTAMQLSKPAEKQLVRSGLMNTRESLDGLLSRAFGGAPALAMFRKTRTERTNAKTDEAALQAWCAAVILKAQQKSPRGTFDKTNFHLDAVRAIARLSAFDDGPVRAQEALSDLGVILVVLAHLPGTHLDGAAMRRSDGVPIIALTLRKDRIDNFWFTLLHELAHVVCHLSDERMMIVDDLEISSAESIEKDADDLAEMALISQAEWSTLQQGTYTSLDDIFCLAKRVGVHPAIVAGRWQLKNRNYRKFAKLLGHGEVRAQFADFGD